MSVYSTREVMEMAGVSRRVLDYLAYEGRIPGQPRKVGSGNAREWTEDQVALIMQHLKATGIRRPLDRKRRHGLVRNGGKIRLDLKARQRAMNRLVALHRDEFDVLFTDEIEREIKANG